MTIQDKLKKLRAFDSEKSFRSFLIDLLKKYGFQDVTLTHRWGYPEKGKDIVARYTHPVDGDDWYAFVVKKGRIGGGSTEVEDVKNQIRQAFTFPYLGVDGREVRINKVKVVTNGNITGGAQDALHQSADLTTFNNYDFWWDEILIEIIDEHYPDFWLPGDIFIKEYSRSLLNSIQNNAEIRDFSPRRIDDKKVKRLLEIFVKPKLSTRNLEYDSKEKRRVPKEESVSISALAADEDNIILSGEQGSGKTRVLNTIASRLADPKELITKALLPVRLNAPEILASESDLKSLVAGEVKALTGPFYNDEFESSFGIVLLVDDIDLLPSKEQETVFSTINDYCFCENNRFILTYRKSDFDLDKDVNKVTIENFNNKQVETFIRRYFDGSERGQRFIRILKESDILSRLPTTPLTITLISLLYDENSYEIPATLSDIYTDFTSVLLGKLKIRDKSDLLEFNMKRRLFTALALKMLNTRNFEIPFEDVKRFMNEFLGKRGCQTHTDNEIYGIIDRSGLLFKDADEMVGFKQTAFVEFMASLEIYHHARSEHYDKLVCNFNDVNWQNTAIFYAGHSKELRGMIDDVINKSPNEGIRDWFINTGGMGYLSQALYQTVPEERKKLVLRAAENMIASFYRLKEVSEEEESMFSKVSMPQILVIVAYWFTTNFKSITLKATLRKAFEDIMCQEDSFDNNFKLLMISTTLMNPYISDDSCFNRMIERQSFINHPLLPFVADLILDSGMVDKKSVRPKFTEALEKEVQKKREYIKAVLKEPAYRFNNENFSINT